MRDTAAVLLAGVDALTSSAATWLHTRDEVASCPPVSLKEPTLLLRLFSP
jgi:hypothetical protein